LKVERLLTNFPRNKEYSQAKANRYICISFQRFYHYLDLKSKHPDASVPPLDYTLRKITEPETDLILQNQSVVDSFRRSFELQGNPLVRKSTQFLIE
jgi:hypothetical protein